MGNWGSGSKALMPLGEERVSPQEKCSLEFIRKDWAGLETP